MVEIKVPKGTEWSFDTARFRCNSKRRRKGGRTARYRINDGGVEEREKVERWGIWTKSGSYEV